jgi:hypothetical protein
MGLRVFTQILFALLMDLGITAFIGPISLGLVKWFIIKNGSFLILLLTLLLFCIATEISMVFFLYSFGFWGLIFYGLLFIANILLTNLFQSKPFPPLVNYTVGLI